MLQANEKVGRHESILVPILLNDDQAAAVLGVSTRMFHALREQPWMPRAIRLGPRALRWARSELEAAVQTMPRQDAGLEPAHLRRARIEALKSRGTPTVG